MSSVASAVAKPITSGADNSISGVESKDAHSIPNGTRDPSARVMTILDTGKERIILAHNNFRGLGLDLGGSSAKNDVKPSERIVGNPECAFDARYSETAEREFREEGFYALVEEVVKNQGKLPAEWDFKADQEQAILTRLETLQADPVYQLLGRQVNQAELEKRDPFLHVEPGDRGYTKASYVIAINASGISRDDISGYLAKKTAIEQVMSPQFMKLPRGSEEQKSLGRFTEASSSVGVRLETAIAFLREYPALKAAKDQAEKAQNSMSAEERAANPVPDITIQDINGDRHKVFGAAFKSYAGKEQQLGLLARSAPEHRR